MAFHYVAEHVENALRELYFQFRHKPVWKAIITAIASGVQDIEDTALDISQSLMLQHATGRQLDLLGRLVGSPRGGLQDERYSKIIQARIQANRSDGDAFAVFEVFETASRTANSTAAYIERYDANITLILTTDEPLTTLERRRVLRLIEIAKAGGVEIRLIYSDPNSLRFHARGSNKQTFDGPLFSSLF